MPPSPKSHYVNHNIVVMYLERGGVLPGDGDPPGPHSGGGGAKQATPRLRLKRRSRPRLHPPARTR